MIIYKSDEYRRCQFFTYSQWPGGLMFSTTISGTKGGGQYAGAWASLMALGEEGYLDQYRKVMETVTYFKQFFDQSEHLRRVGQSASPILSF